MDTLFGLLFLIGITILIYRANSSDKTNDKKQDFPPPPTKDRSPEVILAKVEEIKQAVEEQGLDILICELYTDNIQYYPAWIINNREFVPSMVTKCIQTKKRNTDEDRDEDEITIELNQKEYRIRFEEHDIDLPDEVATHGTISLFDNKTNVFAINISLDFDRYSSKWSAFGIATFKKGAWIEDFTALREQIKKDATGREKKNLKQKAEEAKENFDLD